MIYRKKDFLYKKVKNQYFVINQKKGTLVNLNEVSFFIWDQLKRPQDIKTLLTSLIKEYKVDKNQAKKDIGDFLKNAEKSGIIEKMK